MDAPTWDYTTAYEQDEDSAHLDELYASVLTVDELDPEPDESGEED